MITLFILYQQCGYITIYNPPGIRGLSVIRYWMGPWPQLKCVASWSDVQIGRPWKEPVLIGLVVSSEVNCGPGLQVLREPSAECKEVAVLPGGHWLPSQSSRHQWSIDLMGECSLFEHYSLREDCQKNIFKKVMFCLFRLNCLFFFFK